MLITQLHEDLAASLKRGDSVRVGTLRLILAELGNIAITKYGNQADANVRDADVVEAAKKLAKRHRESIEAFEKGNRQDLVAKEKEQLAIVERFLPTQMSEEELAEILKPLVAAGEQNFGLLMRQAMEKIKGQADGGRVAEILKQMIAAE